MWIVSLVARLIPPCIGLFVIGMKSWSNGHSLR